MKKQIAILAMAVACSTSTVGIAQDSTATEGPWKRDGLFSLTFSQVSLENWQAGGENSLAGNALIKYSANYSKNKWSWSNSLEMAFGGTQLGEGDIQKTDDRFEFSSKVSRGLAKKWDASFLTTFRTQFTEGFNYENDEAVRISHIMAPGYLFAGLGLTYKPTDWINIEISPATSKMTFVLLQELADNGDFGVDAAEYDTNGVKTKDGANFRFELGGYAKIHLKKEVVKNVSLETKADFFSNYLENTENIDITWDVLLVMKVNSWLSANLTTNLIYDDDIDIVTGTREDGSDIVGPRTQFKQTFGAGLTATF
jgi:hypothetical protein